MIPAPSLHLELRTSLISVAVGINNSKATVASPRPSRSRGRQPWTTIKIRFLS